MSAWGISNFENDTALEWVEGLVNSNNGSLLKETIENFVSNFEAESTSLEECLKYLAAVETVAALSGNKAEEIPLELADWIELKYTQLNSAIFKKAIEGVELIMKDSEIKEMYIDSGYFDSWVKNQEDLIKRLKKD